MTLIDTNVLIDVLSVDPIWFDWSAASLERQSVIGSVFINEIVFAELSAQVDSERELEQALAELNVRFVRTPMPALFIAGKTYRRYRAAGGIRTGVLPDFFIGAHAQVAQWPLLTRDVGRYRMYFPEVELITPAA
jgi:predicted nucleic acid-binding protein